MPWRVQAANNAQIREEQKQTNAALDREKQTNDDLVKSIEREVRAKYRQDIQLADRELAADNAGRAKELLDACPVALRGWEWHYLKRIQKIRRQTAPVLNNPGYVYKHTACRPPNKK